MLQIAAGAHTDHKFAVQQLSDIRCLHVPLRAKEIFHNKIEQCARLDAAGFPEWHGWHLRYFARRAKLGRIDEKWAENSEDGGYINAQRDKVPLVHGPLLSTLLDPLL